MKKVFSILALLFLSFATFAQVAVPDAEVSKELLNLLLNFKTLGPIGIGISVVLVLTQALKSDFFGNIFKSVSPLVKRLIVTALGVAYGILLQLQSGIGLGNAILTGLLSSGGAVAIWEALSPILEKKK